MKTASTDKRRSLPDAIATFVRPGSSLFIGGMQHGEPCEAVREIVRQRIGGLTIVPALTQTVALLVGESLVRKLVHAYTTDLFDKKGYAFQRAREHGAYPEIVELSHYGLSLALLAGQMGVPFLPTKAQLGSDLMAYATEQLRAHECPFTGERVAAVRALTPDVAILHAQYADRLGNVRKDGSLGMDRAGAHAARHVIVTVEKIVDREFIRAEPERTLLPGLVVDAVVELPWGAYPLHLHGCYGSGLAGFRQAVQSRENYERYVRQWVDEAPAGQPLAERIAAIHGAEHLASLRAAAAREGVPA